MADQISNLNAAQMYERTAKAAGAQGALADVRGPSFGDILKTSIQESLNTMRAGEQASAKAVTGEASLQEVVGAITQAELTLETVVAVRDRLVSAYQEIMRMPM